MGWAMWMLERRSIGALSVVMQTRMRMSRQSLTLSDKRPASRTKVRLYFKMYALVLYLEAGLTAGCL